MHRRRALWITLLGTLSLSCTSVFQSFFFLLAFPSSSPTNSSFPPFVFPFPSLVLAFGASKFGLLFLFPYFCPLFCSPPIAHVCFFFLPFSSSSPPFLSPNSDREWHLGTCTHRSSSTDPVLELLAQLAGISPLDWPPPCDTSFQEEHLSAHFFPQSPRHKIHLNPPVDLT